jgi:sugar O-acyltransferase (sialic acid O-acetyltransferase NeuD family)
MCKNLIIIGASGHGKVIVDIAQKINKWENIFFLDDDVSIKEIMGMKVVGTIPDAEKYRDNTQFIVAIGNNKIRKRVQEELAIKKCKIVSLIHPDAVIGSDVEIGTGTVVMAGVVINAGSQIGNGCIINTSSSLDHENIIGDYVHVSPGAHLAGAVRVSEGCWLGIGSLISNNITICENCIIGAGAVIVSDIVESGKYVGIPAQKM